MPGAEIVPKASFNATRAITIDAPPERAWPWIVQMGYRGAGFCTYAPDRSVGRPGPKVEPQLSTRQQPAAEPPAWGGAS